MYHCHVHFYFIGHQHRIMDVVKEMSPLDNFTHEFSEGDVPEAEMAAKADVIFAGLQNMDVEQTLQTLASSYKFSANGESETLFPHLTWASSIYPLSRTAGPTEAYSVPCPTTG